MATSLSGLNWRPWELLRMTDTCLRIVLLDTFNHTCDVVGFVGINLIHSY